jgi:DNA-binding CsgD family transcriptional regulator
MMPPACPEPADGGNGAAPETGDACLGPVLARFVVDGQECGIVPLNEGTELIAALAGTLHLAGRRYGVVCTNQSNGPDPLERLSPREFEIAALITCGCSDKEIARRLGISTHTVGAHMARCFAKLGVHKRAELAATIARKVSPYRWSRLPSAEAGK